MLKHFNLNRLLTTPSSSVIVSNLRQLCIEPKTKRGSRKILDHYNKFGQATNLNLFPTNLKRVSNKKSQQIYVANEQAAQKIANAISRFSKKNVPFVELSPGPCILSNALLNEMDIETLILIQKDKEFADSQKKLQEMHNSKVHLNAVKAKWNFHSSICDSIFKFCKQRKWNEDVVFQLFFYSRLEDIHRLNVDVIRQTGFFEYGRAEIFTIMTTLDFMKLTGGPTSPYWLYTHLSCLFQIIFEYEQLAEFPVDNFLPWHCPKPGYGGKIEHDTNSLYLVRMTPKPNLFSICNRDDLPRLRFFIYQCLFKRSGFIIPKLEKWIPNIGIDLISENFNKTTSTQIQANNEDNLLGNLTNKFQVFTKCGSLTPLEICALFQFFRQTSMYKASCFHQQYTDFFTTKSNKKHTTPNSNSDQINSNDYGDDEFKIDTTHVKNSIE